MLPGLAQRGPRDNYSRWRRIVPTTHAFQPTDRLPWNNPIAAANQCRPHNGASGARRRESTAVYIKQAGSFPKSTHIPPPPPPVHSGSRYGNKQELCLRLCCVFPRTRPVAHGRMHFPVQQYDICTVSRLFDEIGNVGADVVRQSLRQLARNPVVSDRHLNAVFCPVQLLRDHTEDTLRRKGSRRKRTRHQNRHFWQYIEDCCGSTGCSLDSSLANMCTSQKKNLGRIFLSIRSNTNSDQNYFFYFFAFGHRIGKKKNAQQAARREAVHHRQIHLDFLRPITHQGRQY